MGSGSATGKKFQVRLVHSLLKYFFKFQLWYWIKNLHYQIFKFVIDNSDISLNCLQHIQKRRNLDAKVTCHQPICLLLHAILSGVGVQNLLFVKVFIWRIKFPCNFCKSMAFSNFSYNTLFNATSVKLRLRALSMQKGMCGSWVGKIKSEWKIVTRVWRPYLRK